MYCKHYMDIKKTKVYNYEFSKREEKEKYASINRRRMLQPYTYFLLLVILSNTLV